MLVKIKGVLVPHDMDVDLLDFILKNEGKSRFVIGIHIPEATGWRFAYDTAHIVAMDGELKVHSRNRSRPYQLYMYAWEHVYCLMPSAKGKRKLNSGWIGPHAIHEAVADPEFGTTWHSKDFTKFVKDQLVHCSTRPQKS